MVVFRERTVPLSDKVKKVIIRGGVMKKWIESFWQKVVCSNVP